ncbi:helix-turn-helix transcriptional regulator [Ornithinimicrobium kibberense]|uniref:helix-turn-helix transcriptional regulator n=1 Tax=Ornithinimicrobium kibberense TaxID=282060 RepID=UPI003609FAEE
MTVTGIRHDGGVTASPDRPPVGAPTPSRHSRGETYEEFLSRVYMAAVRLGVPSRSALRQSGLSDADVDDAVAELVERGMLSSSEDPDRWFVVPPREALTRRMDQVERRVALTRATASEVESLWRRAMGDVGQARGPAQVDGLAGTVEIAHRIAELHRSATTRVWWAVDASVAATGLFADLAAGSTRLSVREEVQVRLVLDSSLLGDPYALAFADRARELGHEVRVANGVPFSVLMTDDKDVLVDLSRYAEDGDGSFGAHRVTWVQALSQLLVAIWDLATPYGTVLTAGQVGEGPPVVPGRLPLGDKDARVLALLATGASDKIIARQLGVSVRTVERRVRYLMEHLGAATRFQAGVQAVRRGRV